MSDLDIPAVAIEMVSAPRRLRRDVRQAHDHRPSTAGPSWLVERRGRCANAPLILRLSKGANVIAEVSRGLGDCMPGLDVRSMTDEQRLALRGW